MKSLTFVLSCLKRKKNRMLFFYRFCVVVFVVIAVSLLLFVSFVCFLLFHLSLILQEREYVVRPSRRRRLHLREARSRCFFFFSFFYSNLKYNKLFNLCSFLLLNLHLLFLLCSNSKIQKSSLTLFLFCFAKRI